jgi:hypothetical protein
MTSIMKHKQLKMIKKTFKTCKCKTSFQLKKLFIGGKSILNFEKFTK